MLLRTDQRWYANLKAYLFRLAAGSLGFRSKLNLAGRPFRKREDATFSTGGNSAVKLIGVSGVGLQAVSCLSELINELEAY
jgi:hypothetical protein